MRTKPVYEAMVAAGFLRKCIPAPAGGDNAGLIDMTSAANFRDSSRSSRWCDVSLKSMAIRTFQIVR